MSNLNSLVLCIVETEIADQHGPSWGNCHFHDNVSPTHTCWTCVTKFVWISSVSDIHYIICSVVNIDITMRIFWRAKQLLDVSSDRTQGNNALPHIGRCGDLSFNNSIALSS